MAEFVERTKAEYGCVYYGWTKQGDKLFCREAYVDGAKKPPVSFDMSPTDRDKKAVRLMKTHTDKLFEAFHKVLDNRPAKTLTHGDMRGDNMFKKNDGSGFTVIDWQTYGASTPGVEMHQLFANQMDDLAESRAAAVVALQSWARGMAARGQWRRTQAAAETLRRASPDALRSLNRRILGMVVEGELGKAARQLTPQAMAPCGDSYVGWLRGK